ncbi:MAG: LuxR C-terminal-related transcriptional regulator, partial [Acidimicrobiia bacterium]
AAAAIGDPLRTFIAEMRSLNLMWGLHRHADALTVNRTAQSEAEDPAAAVELALWEATLLTYSGQPRAALAVLEAVGEITAPRARALHAIAEVSALAATGRAETAAATARVAYAEHAQLGPQIAIADAGLHVINEIYALCEAGALRGAHELASAMYRALPPNTPPAGFMWATHLLGRSALLLGEVATARRWLAEAVARCAEHDLHGPSRLALSLLATAHAWLGDERAAAAAVADLDRQPEFGYARAEQELGRAWALVAAGDAPAARRVLYEAAGLAATSGYRVTEAWILHDIARLGEPAAVADQLERIAAECEGPLVASYAAHARAAAGERAEPLLAAADAFDAIGASLLAAEAAMEAARAYQRQGDRRAASAASLRATQYLERCEGAHTPAVATTDSLVPLSAREREIATFAARGDTATEIAARLFLSKRTVNNHLQNVYTKLGISGRSDLAAALHAATPFKPDDPSHPPSSSRP